MATRRAVLSPEHVSALNLIEIEFHRNSHVISAWKAYFRNLSTRFEPKDTEKVTRERQALLTKLLSEMAKALRIRIEQLDIFEGGYIPQGAVDIEQQDVEFRNLVMDIFSGKRSIPIEIRSQKED